MKCLNLWNVLSIKGPIYDIVIYEMSQRRLRIPLWIWHAVFIDGDTRNNAQNSFKQDYLNKIYNAANWT